MPPTKSKSALRPGAPGRRSPLHGPKGAAAAASKSRFFTFKVPIEKRATYKAILKMKTHEAVLTFIDLYGKALRTGRLVDIVVSPRDAVQVRERTSSSDDRARDPALENELAEARRRGRIRVAEILRGADMLSADEFADVLGTTRMTVNAKRQKHEVLALQGATRGFRYPRWQIDANGRPFDALPRIFETFEGDTWSVYRFLAQHHPELDGLTGHEALNQGKADEVLEVAQSVLRDFA